MIGNTFVEIATNSARACSTRRNLRETAQTPSVMRCERPDAIVALRWADSYEVDEHVRYAADSAAHDAPRDDRRRHALIRTTCEHRAITAEFLHPELLRQQSQRADLPRTVILRVVRRPSTAESHHGEILPADDGPKRTCAPARPSPPSEVMDE